MTAYLIYKATCGVTGGSYIGVTSRGLAVRKKEHCHARKDGRVCPAFHAAIQKHGKTNFSWSVLIDGLSADEASHLEKFLISALKPRYNVANGGLSGSGFAGSVRSPETRARMRVAAKKRGISPSAHKARIESQRKYIVCNETGTVFRDAAEAAMAHGVKRSHIYDLLFKGRVSRMAGVSFRRATPVEARVQNAMEV